MKPINYLATITILHLTRVLACMHYRATLPFSHFLPVEATIEDNGKVTCWIHKTYEQHEIEQGIFQKTLLLGERLRPSLAAPSVLKAQEEEKAKGTGNKKGLVKRSGNERIRLTERIPLKAEEEMWDSVEVQKSVRNSYQTSDQDGKYSQIPGTHLTLGPPAPKSAEQKAAEDAAKAASKLKKEERKKERLAMGETESEMWGLDDESEYWMKWWFTCLPGYRARMEPGGKQIVYWANEHEFFFSPKEQEDQVGERWVYETILWCAGGAKEAEKKAADGKENDKAKKISLS